MNKLLTIRILSRRFSLSSCNGRALNWPKPCYGPCEVHWSEFMNGMRIAAAKSSGTQIATCTIMFQAGSRNEIDNELGVTHILRAATTANGCAYSGFIKSRYLQQYGGYITCASDRQTISFTLRCPIPVFTDLKQYLLDTAVRCYYRQVDLVETVRPMVKADLKRIPSEQLVMDLIQKACWAGPLNNSVFCDESRIGEITPDILNCYAGTFFKTNRCTIGSVGVPFDETIMLAEHIDCGRAERPPDIRQRTSNPRGGYETRNLGPGSDTYIAVAVPGCGTCDIPTLMKYAVVASSCGTGNIQIGQHAMDRTPHPPLGMLSGDDVCTEFKAFNVSYQETGVFGILVKTRPETARKAAFAATEFLSNIGGLSYSQIEVGKRRLKVAMAINDDNSVLTSEALALQAANNGQMESATQSICMIDCICPGDVSCAASTLQCLVRSPNMMAVAVVGDVGATPHDEELREVLYK